MVNLCIVVFMVGKEKHRKLHVWMRGNKKIMRIHDQKVIHLQ